MRLLQFLVHYLQLQVVFLLDSYPAEIVQEIYAQGINDTLMGIICAVQYAGYGLFLGAIGILVAKKIGLWKDETTITRKPLMAAIVISVIGGLCLILPDILFVPVSKVVLACYF